MIIQCQPHLNSDQVKHLQTQLHQQGITTVRSPYHNEAVLVAVASSATAPLSALQTHPDIQEVRPMTSRHRLTSRTLQPQDTVITIKGHRIGGKHLTVMAGPCAIESPQQIDAIAGAVKNAGAQVLRGGAYKPRTSPYDFQGLGEAGLIAMRQAANRHGLLCISEAVDTESLQHVSQHADLIQIGSRNMHNFELLKQAGQCPNPVLLKRGMCATYQEFVLAAEYIVSHGNPNVILCERGIRCFENATRNCLDLAAIVVLKSMTHLPVIIDPSHGTGRRDAIAPMSYAAIAAGAHGLIIETHTHPDQALSDAQQTIDTDTFKQLMLGVTQLKNTPLFQPDSSTIPR